MIFWPRSPRVGGYQLFITNPTLGTNRVLVGAATSGKITLGVFSVMNLSLLGLSNIDRIIWGLLCSLSWWWLFLGCERSGFVELMVEKQLFIKISHPYLSMSSWTAANT